MKYRAGRQRHPGQSRAPYGARGLKCNRAHNGIAVIGVAPRMGRVD